MSRAALKEALDLFELEERESEKPSTVSGLKEKRQSQKESTFSQVKKKLSKAELRKERIKSQGKLKKSVQDLSMKCILDDIRQEKNIDHSKRNLEIMKYVSEMTSTSIGRNEVGKILVHNKGRLTKNKRQEATSTSDDKKTVFTDADFEEFERTYFCNS